MRPFLVAILFSFFGLSIVAQSDSTVNKKVQVSGYLKFLQGNYTVQQSSLISDQLIHQRLNFKQKLNKNHEWVAEFRNRIFFGQLVQLNQLQGKYLDQIDPNANRLFKPDIGWESKKGIAALIALDRAYWQWTPKDWELRLGRQRVNWGISTIWNPNDIFNAYGFTDFDYEERPSVDGLRIKRFIGYSGSLEAVASVGRDFSDMSYGIMYKTNVKSYDLQFLAGYSDQHYAFGMGTAGNLGLAGLKAESTAFVPENGGQTSLATTFAIDYTLSGGTYLSVGGLYNSEGNTTGDLSTLFSFELSARNLYPYTWAALASVQQQVSPLSALGLVAVYSPVRSQALFLNPSFSYSIAQAWDIDVIAQLAFSQNVQKYESSLMGFFLRLKWSY